MSTTDPDRRRADEILTHATTYAHYGTDARRHLDEWLAGYGDSTPGANPATDPTALVDLDPEGTAGTGQLRTDPARRDLEQLNEAVRQMVHHGRIAAAIVKRYADPKIDATLAGALRADDPRGWCENHLRHGIPRVPARADGTVCRYCSDFRSRWKTDAPRKVLEYRAMGDHLDAAKIAQFIREAKAEAAEARRAARRAAKLEAAEAAS